MADDTNAGDEILRNSINNESRNISEENTSPKETEENMEVHHHSHAHGKKNWRTYVWEFLMLFLAVFCGFLAEYQLEHKIESNREKQYIESMVQDLSEDTAKMSIQIALNTDKVAAIDSLLNNIFATPYTDSSLKIIYRLHTRLRGRYQVYFTKRTITQLQNSGGLRLIRNKGASDSIVVYDERCKQIETLWDVLFMAQIKARELEFKIFDPRYFLNPLLTPRPAPVWYRSNTKFTLLNEDEKMMEYTNWVLAYQIGLTNYVSMLKRHMERAVRIMRFLHKEYHLE
jgi:hypothetical protein